MADPGSGGVLPTPTGPGPGPGPGLFDPGETEDASEVVEVVVPLTFDAPDCHVEGGCCKPAEAKSLVIDTHGKVSFGLKQCCKISLNPIASNS